MPIWLNKDFSYWYSAKYLCLVQDLAIEWEDCNKRMNSGGWILYGEEDTLIWSANGMTGNITAKNAYQAIVQNFNITAQKS